MQKVFDNYSKYYDLLYYDKDYEGESEYIHSLVQKYKPETNSVLELGCGTGKHACLLNKYYDIFGIDLSESMLSQAKDLGVKCEVGDVRTYRCNKTFDTVLSLFHVASYQTSDEDISQFFETVSHHLNKGGLVIFDIWYKPAVLAQLPEARVKELENNEIKVIRHCNPNHLKEKSVVEVNYDIEITDKYNGEIQKIQEKHPMRYFSADELTQFSMQYGIEIIHTEEWLSGKKPDETTWGVCFVGVKK